MTEYIECRDCGSPNCKGCNIYTLATMLHAGKLDCLMDEHRSIRQFADAARVLPAVDAVEVVRCKDCKHCSDNTPDGLHWCNEHERGLLDDDDFCSRGERRTDDV